MKTYKIHFIRHGLTEQSEDGRYIGRRDLPLSLEGRRLLLALKEEYGYPAVQKVYRSPLRRCEETAALLYPDSWTEIVEGFNELNLGVFEGKTVSELKNDPNYKKWIKGEEQRAPGGESGEEFMRRTVLAFGEMLEDMIAHKITSAAVVTHGGVLMNLLSALGIPKRPMQQWAVSAGMGYTVLVDAAMWMRSGAFEVYAALPVGIDKVDTQRDYEVYELERDSEGDEADG